VLIESTVACWLVQFQIGICSIDLDAGEQPSQETSLRFVPTSFATLQETLIVIVSRDGVKIHFTGPTVSPTSYCTSPDLLFFLSNNTTPFLSAIPATT